MHDELSRIDDALQALREGRIVIVVDDEDRENEGDFIAAAEKVSPETIEFMITHGRGLLCMPILPETAARLQLGPMVERNTAPHQTPYTVPVDHISCRTGISAQERARTVRAIIDPATQPDDLVRPGHLFPLVAKEGGVLRRAGHTEATVDLCRLAGLARGGRPLRGARRDRRRQPRAAARDRSRARSADRLDRGADPVSPHARKAGSPRCRGRSADPLRARPRSSATESSTSRAMSRSRSSWAICASVECPLVRLHSSCFTGDLLDSLRCDCGDQLHMALAMIGNEGAGALIYLPQEGRGIGLIEKIRAYNLQDNGLDTVQANVALGYRADTRDYGIGLQILKDLGLSRVRLLTNNPKKTDAFVYYGYELKVVDQVPIVAPEVAERRRYLDAKRDKMGHLLPSSSCCEPAPPAGSVMPDSPQLA